MSFRTASGHLVAVGQKLAAGGEGEVFAVSSPNGVVFKRYRPQILAKAPTPERKLGTMVACRPARWRETSGHVTLAWPLDVVRESGRFAGFLMPVVDTTNTVELHRVANPTDRRTASGAQSWLRGFTWNYLVRTAANLAQATQLLHEASAVIGDFNERNILVTSRARVTLIDCDSMQIQSPGGEYFLCRVGRLDFTPPELLNANWQTTVRQPSSDLFALAVHIYQLLLEGEHPFRGTWTGQGDKPDAHVLAHQGNWAHKNGGPLRPRRAAVDFDLLPDSIRTLFRRAFEDGATRPSARPTAVEWYQALSALDRGLQKCRTNPDHFYPAGHRTCPWCRHQQRASGGAGPTTALPGRVQRPMPAATAPTVAAFLGTGTTRGTVRLPRAHAAPGNPAPLAGALTDAGLSRQAGRMSLFMASTGSMIGAGWLFGAVYAAMFAGPSALLAWIVGGVAVLGLALVHAELCAMFPVAGGPARFPLRAFGGVVGATFGWAAWLQAAATVPIEVLAVESYFSQWEPSWLPGLYDPGDALPTGKGYLVALVLAGIFTWVNLRGIHALTRLNNVATWFKIAAIVLICGELITHFHGGNFGSPLPYGAHGVLSAVSSGGVMFAYLGFEQAGQFAGEARNPQRDVPWAIIGSVVAATVLYLLLQTCFIGALPAADLTNGFADIGSSAALTQGLLGLAGMVGVTGGVLSILRASPVIGAAGSGLAYSGATGRMSYGLARSGLAPAVFARANGRGAPFIAMIPVFVASALFMLPGQGWNEFVSDATTASGLMYAGAPLCLGAFRLQFPQQSRPYRLPGASFLGPATFTVASLIIYWSGWDSDWRVGLALIIGTVLILVVQRPVNLNPKAALWLAVYVVGLGIISWLGSYGGGAGVLPMWWDVVIVTLFSTAIYHWAIHTRL
jgi:amino acid transporter